MNQLSFQVSCIEFYAEYKHLKSPDVYKQFIAADLLSHLKSDYEDLHGMSFEYLMQYFDNYLEAKNASISRLNNNNR